MNRSRKSVVSLMLGLITCLMIVVISTPSMSKSAGGNVFVPTTTASHAVSATSKPASEAIANQLALHLQEAETLLLAQTEPAPMPMTTDMAPTSGAAMVRYVAVMSGNGIVPSPASTYAFGSAGAVLLGNRLVIRGDFSGLTSPLRDYAINPLNPPNPKITSGIHVHKGEPSKNGPFQYALTVEPRADQRSGRFRGEYTLTDEQLQALSNGTLYMDLHTQQNRAGELRGIFKAY